MNYIVLITTIISSIKSVEALMPASPGTDKLNAVLVMVESAVGEIESVLPAITSLIAGLVAAYNASGLFKKAAAPAPAPAPAPAAA